MHIVTFEHFWKNLLNLLLIIIIFTLNLNPTMVFQTVLGKKRNLFLLAAGDLLPHGVSSVEPTELCAFPTWRARGEREPLI